MSCHGPKIIKVEYFISKIVANEMIKSRSVGDSNTNTGSTKSGISRTLAVMAYKIVYIKYSVILA